MSFKSSDYPKQNNSAWITENWHKQQSLSAGWVTVPWEARMAGEVTSPSATMAPGTAIGSRG